MATYEYRIITTAPGSTIETRWTQPEDWTHETAIHWARTVGRNLPEGTRIQIDRRRGMTMYQAHRRYEVRGGITRRIGN